METVTWPGISGKVYTTELCRFGIPFNRNPGVYIFCKPGTISGKWAQIYVGECEDFNNRLNENLLNHHRWDCIKREGATNVCVIRVDGGKAARTAIETDLRQQLDPPCNRQ
jgi:hypothetical protein